jgi:exonuclease SbcC
MLEKLTIKGFQCHEERVIELEMINVICGNNDSGKSAILRALRWLALNQWDGKAGEFIHWKMEACAVSLEVDGHVISRQRSKDSNLYVLDGEVYKVFGNDPPYCIQDILNISETNFQDQDDPAFWLTLTSGQAASALNEIFCLTAIDEALSNANGEVRHAKAKLEVSEERRDKARESKKELEWIDGCDELLQELERIYSEREECQTRADELERAVDQLQEIEAIHQHGKLLLIQGQELLALGTEILRMKEELRSLEQLQQLEEERCQLEKELEEKQKLLNQWMGSKCPLCGK